MQDPSVEKLFQKQIKHYIKSDHSSSKSPLIELFTSWLRQNKIKKKLDIIEFGGGGGQLLKSLNDIYPNNNLYNLEIVENYRKHQSLKKIKFIHGSILNSNLSDKSVDVLIIRDVLHHLIGKNLNETLKDQLIALKELKRIIRPNGIILIEELVNQSNLVCRLIYILSRLNSKIGIKSDKYWITPDTIICMFTPDRLKKTLKKIFNGNLKIVEFRISRENWKGRIVHLGSPYGKFISVIQMKNSKK